MNDVYDIDEALMIIRDHERYDETEFKDAVAVMLDVISRRLKLEDDFRML